MLAKLRITEHCGSAAAGRVTSHINKQQQLLFYIIRNAVKTDKIQTGIIAIDMTLRVMYKKCYVNKV